MSRGSGLTRAVRFFKEADLEEAEYVLGRALSIVQERRAKVDGPAQNLKARKARKPKTNALPLPAAQPPLEM